MKTVTFKIFFFLLILLLGACVTNDSLISKTTATLANEPGRHFSSLSVHPNSEELLFLEFVPSLPNVSRLLRYHLKTKQLRYYDLPINYVTVEAAFSPTGKYIVMRRVPSLKGSEDDRREAYERSEIAIMRSDGTDFKTIALSKGLKMSPVMSHDETRIAYWRATQRPDGSKSFASHFDVWELDLKTGQDKPFAGLHEFFGGGQMQYLKDGIQILVGADTPTSVKMPGRNADNFSNSMTDYYKKYNNSNVYLLVRDQEKLPAPLMTEINSAMHPSIDAKGDYYFYGWTAEKGMSLFSKNSNNFISQWVIPINSFGDRSDVVVTPNRTGLFFIFNYLNSPARERTHRGIAIFNIEQNNWMQISIPSLNMAKSISESTRLR